MRNTVGAYYRRTESVHNNLYSACSVYLDLYCRIKLPVYLNGSFDLNPYSCYLFKYCRTACLLYTSNASLVTPRELFVEALKKEAVSMILLHNHPSGDPTPSRDDILTTKRISECGLLIGIELLDHIIIGNNCYVSFQEENLLWKG